MDSLSWYPAGPSNKMNSREHGLRGGISVNLKQLRKMHGMTQVELAKSSGVSQGKICEYERKKVVPRIDTVQKIANALGCTIDDLVKGESEAVKPT